MNNSRTVYKLTDHRHQTRGGMQWGDNVYNCIQQQAPCVSHAGLCSAGWIHYYTSPELASLLHPAHTSYPARVLWKAATHGDILEESGLKGGAQGLTTLHMVPLPYFSFEQRISFMLWALQGCARTGEELELIMAWDSGDFFAVSSMAERMFYHATPVATPLMCAAHAICQLKLHRHPDWRHPDWRLHESNLAFSTGIKQCAHTVTETFSQWNRHAPADLIQSGVEYALTLRHP